MSILIFILLHICNSEISKMFKICQEYKIDQLRKIARNYNIKGTSKIKICQQLEEVAKQSGQELHDLLKANKQTSAKNNRECLRREQQNLNEIYGNVKKIGAGAQGVVFKTNNNLALKSIPFIDKEFNNIKCQSIPSEFQLLEEVKCKTKKDCGIVRTSDIFLHVPTKSIIFEMDYFPGGDGKKFQKYLADLLLNNKIAEFVDLIVDNFLYTTKTLRWIHSKCVLHRDIKPTNFLYDEKKHRLFYTDFGVSCLLVEQCELTLAGTTNYFDPYLLYVDVAQNEKSDIFSLGATFYQFLLNEKLIKSGENENTEEEEEEEEEKQLSKKEYLNIYNQAKKKLRNFVKKIEKELKQSDDEDNKDELILILSTIIEIIIEMINPFHPEKRPTLKSIIKAVDNADIDLLEFTPQYNEECIL